MPDPSKEAFAELFIIAHAVNDAVDAKIAELKAYKGGGSPGWEMEDYYRNQRELQEMRNAKAFTEALLLFAGKDGQLDPVETERVGFALATEPHLYDDPPKLSFFLFKPGDMDKLMQRFLGNHTEQIDARIASKGRAEINTGKAFEDAMAAIKTTPPTVVLENFLKVVPFISEKMRALAEPTIELRQIVDKITKPAYRQNEFITADLMNVSMHFSDLRYNHFKDSPPPELMKIEQEYNQWDEAVRLTNRNDRPFTRSDIAVLKKSADVWKDIRRTLEDHSTGTEGWPPMSEETGKAFSRLSYLAGEITEALQNRFPEIGSPAHGMTPGDVTRSSDNTQNLGNG